MVHACVERFDVMGERGNILGWDEEVNKAIDTESMHTGHTTALGVVFPVCFRICLVGYQNFTCL
jgi:hypothetical protein